MFFFAITFSLYFFDWLIFGPSDKIPSKKTSNKRRLKFDWLTLLLNLYMCLHTRFYEKVKLIYSHGNYTTISTSTKQQAPVRLIWNLSSVLREQILRIMQIKRKTSIWLEHLNLFDSECIIERLCHQRHFDSNQRNGRTCKKYLIFARAIIPSGLSRILDN